MERLWKFKEKFEDIVEEVLTEDVGNIDAEEMGEVIDIIKDLTEAIYYSSVVEAMKESGYSKELMPQAIRNRMYYKDDSEVTYDDVIDDINAIASGDDRAIIKQKLIDYITMM